MKQKSKSRIVKSKGKRARPKRTAKGGSKAIEDTYEKWLSGQKVKSQVSSSTHFRAPTNTFEQWLTKQEVKTTQARGSVTVEASYEKWLEKQVEAKKAEGEDSSTAELAVAEKSGAIMATSEN